MRGAPSAAAQRRDEIGALGVPAQHVFDRGQHAIGAHRTVVVGDVVEHAGVLTALDLGDRQPSQGAGAQQIEIAAPLADGAQPAVLRGADIPRDACSVSLSAASCSWRWRCLAAAGSLPALAWRSALVASSLAAASDSGVPSSGAVSGSAAAARDQARPQRELALQAAESVAHDEGLAPVGNTTTRSPAQPRRSPRSVRARLQVGDRDGVRGLGHGCCP